jgi:AcrR family transcriptional regulator
MVDQLERPPERRERLTRDRVLRAAVEMADASGIEKLTMRALAQSLGVEAMSLYYHVKNKDDILDGMIDVIITEVDVPVPGGDWRSAQHRRATSLHDMLTHHPWAAPLMESRSNPGPASLRYYDAVIGSFRQAGFSIGMAAHAFSAIDAYVYGFGLQELSLPFEDETDVGDIAEALLQALPPDEYPHLTEMILGHALQPGYDYSAEFPWGLDLILDGFEQRLGEV